jgi:hypothetical protein
MHFSAILIASLAAAGCTAKVTNPHHKAQQFARPALVKKTPQPTSLRKRSVSQYLNDDTESKYLTAGNNSEGDGLSRGC